MLIHLMESIGKMFNSGIADGFCGTRFCKENCRKCVRNGSFKAYIFIEANDESGRMEKWKRKQC